MRIGHLSILIIVLTLSLCGCTTSYRRTPIPENAAPIDVEFSWQGVAPCTAGSPEIRVSNLPAGVAQFQVALTNLSVPEWNQGGGRVPNDGSGVIPAGSLTIGYNGPCPPTGKRQTYEFSVMAVDDAGAIIGFGKARQPFPPKT